MAAVTVNCPNCQRLLDLPEEIGEARVRCPACRHVFRVRAARKPSVEETVADWLHEEEQDRGEARLEAAPGGARTAPAAAAAPAEARIEAAPAARAAPLRLVSMERRGVLFEFPADNLRREDFRCAIPRACVHCLARVHLSAHVIIYASPLRDSISLEAEHAAGQLSIPQEQLRDVEGTAVLKLLPEVPNVPSPGNLPMPYWVCELCSGAGRISGQIRVNPDTGKGICRLLIRNLKLALAFCKRVCGGRGGDYERLKEFVEHMEEDPWDALPSVVRHRVEQWFRPRLGERFLAYVPDRAFVRTQDGMNGLAISTHRVVYHHPPLHQEAPRQNELTIQVRQAQGKDIATVQAAHFKGRMIALDRSGMMLFRRALSQGGFTAKWR